LPKIKVPRCLQQKEEVTSISVHVFVDASEVAYGAVVYLRVEYKNRRVSVSFVTSKTTIAPLQSISIPCLELMGAVLSKRIGLFVVEVLNIGKEFITFWIDSTSVLWWVKGHIRHFKPFIANRIGELQETTSPERWRYVPTKENSTDYLTRGATLMELAQQKEWWEISL